MKFKTLLFDVDDTLLDFQLTEKKSTTSAFSTRRTDIDR